MKSEKLNLSDLLPNPVLIKSDYLVDNITEYVLKQIILNNLDYFLIQMLLKQIRKLQIFLHSHRIPIFLFLIMFKILTIWVI